MYLKLSKQPVIASFLIALNNRSSMSDWLDTKSERVSRRRLNATQRMKKNMAFLSSLYKALRITILNRKWTERKTPNYKLMGGWVAAEIHNNWKFCVLLIVLCVTEPLKLASKSRRGNLLLCFGSAHSCSHPFIGRSEENRSTVWEGGEQKINDKYVVSLSSKAHSFRLRKSAFIDCCEKG